MRMTDGDEGGVCGGDAPAIARRGGVAVLAGTAVAVRDVVAALEREESVEAAAEATGLSVEAVALVEAAWEREPAALEG